MPNNVINIVTVNDDVFSQVKQLMVSGNEITFNKLIQDNSADGVGDLLDWRRENWGTKWDAYESQVDDGILTFQTAWSAPKPVILKLFGLVPNGWLWEYACECDFTTGCGSVEAIDGELVSPSFNNTEDEDIRLGCRLWGMDYDEYMEVWGAKWR